MTPKLAVPFVLLAACVDIDHAVAPQEIVGGTQTTTTSFPTVVALQRGTGNWFCSGVLVDKDWVLTTASCFDSTAATQVRIGDSNLTDGTVNGLTINVAAIHKHPQFSFNDTIWRHDVALLRLAQSVTDRSPTPIRRTAIPTNTSITQAGFGTNSNNGSGGGILRSLATTNIDCAGANDSGIKNENLLCFNAADGTGSCYGDGGAPAFVASTDGRVVVGVASGGTGSSCTSGYDIYTSLAPELGFLDSLLPQPTPPTDPPADPPPPNPDDTGSGSGSGSGGGRDPDESTSSSGVKGKNLDAACSAGRESTMLVIVVVVAFALVRRRATR